MTWRENAKRDSEELNHDYWDCECYNHFIHSKSQKYCPICNTKMDQGADSIQSDINEKGVSVLYKRSLITKMRQKKVIIPYSGNLTDNKRKELSKKFNDQLIGDLSTDIDYITNHLQNKWFTSVEKNIYVTKLPDGSTNIDTNNSHFNCLKDELVILDL